MFQRQMTLLTMSGGYLTHLPVASPVARSRKRLRRYSGLRMTNLLLNAVNSNFFR